jgi:hypothetical protein
MLLLISRKYDLGCLSRIGSRIRIFFLSLISDPDPDPGVKKALDPGSRIRIRNTRNKISTPLVVDAGSRQLFVSVIRGVDDSPHQEYGEFPENNSARYPESATLYIYQRWWEPVIFDYEYLCEFEAKIVKGPQPNRFIQKIEKIGLIAMSLLEAVGRRSHIVHRVVTSAFWRTFNHEGKIRPGWWGWRVHAHPLSLHLPSPVKLQCTLLSGQIH